MSLDAVSLVEFVVPLLMALVFTMLAYTELKSKKADMGSLFSMLASAICWFIFGLTWAGVTTTTMFVSIAYLWYAFGVIFSLLTLYTGLKMLGLIFQEKIPRLTLEESKEED